jgi:DNA/RNA-binding domain of Phe-tRNA-synthetase-like protein
MTGTPTWELPFSVVHELDGWSLFWALLEPEPVVPASLDRLCAEIAHRVWQRSSLSALSSQPALAEMRRLFRSVGTDPTRYRPSSEALLRRLLKGNEIPRIHPLVDLNNCLSADLAVPCCVMDERAIEPPFTLRAGREGESFRSLRGLFQLGGRPLLADSRGPCDAPITGGERVKVRSDTARAWLVAYLPASIITPENASTRLLDLLRVAPAATVRQLGAST